jgi:fructokinase
VSKDTGHQRRHAVLGGEGQLIVITVVGESLVDVVFRPGSDAQTVHPGGSPANVAVALSRLGQASALVTQIGADENGALLREYLARNGVEVVLAGPTTVPTSRALAHLDASGAATYQFELSWDVGELRLADGSSALHVGSLGLVLEPGAREVLHLVETVSRLGDVVVSYDPNFRSSVTSDHSQAAATAERVARAAHIMKLSDEDLAFLYPSARPEHLARHLFRAESGMSQLLVVTRGARGAMVATRTSFLSVAAVPVPVVDTVGAGDAFMAALLAGLAEVRLLSPHGLAKCSARPEVLYRVVGQAMTAAALTCARAGADPPTREELRRFWATLGAGSPAPG